MATQRAQGGGARTCVVGSDDMLWWRMSGRYWGKMKGIDGGKDLALPLSTAISVETVLQWSTRPSSWFSLVMASTPSVPTRTNSWLWIWTCMSIFIARNWFLLGRREYSPSPGKIMMKDECFTVGLFQHWWLLRAAMLGLFLHRSLSSFLNIVHSSFIIACRHYPPHKSVHHRLAHAVLPFALSNFLANF